MPGSLVGTRRVFLRGAALTLPYTFTPGAAGGMPAPWSGATWAQASNTVTNSPTLGGELLTDPDLEATYTAGLCDTLTKTGSPTVAQSADAHKGSKAQQFTGVAVSNQIRFPLVAGVVGNWYLFSLWRKVTAGSVYDNRARITQTGALPGANGDIGNLSASYVQERAVIVSTTTNNITVSPAVELGSSNFDTVIVDDCSLQVATSLCAMLPATQANVVAKLATPGAWASFTDSSYFGIVLRGSEQTGEVPTNCLLALLRRRASGPSLGMAALIKKIGTTYTSVIAETNVTLAASADLEVRASGSTVSLWYNGAQVGTDQTISDAQLVNNTFHGLFSAGGNPLGRFFLQAN